MCDVKYMVYDFELADLDFNIIEDSSSLDDYGLGEIFQQINGYVKLHLSLTNSDTIHFYKNISPACPEKAFFVREAKIFQKIYDDQILDIIKYRDIICRNNDEEETPKSTNIISHKSVFHMLNYEEIRSVYDSGLPKTRSFFSVMIEYSSPTDISFEDRLKLIRVDICVIKRDLVSFLLIFRMCGHNIQNKSELQAFIDIAEIKLSDLDIYWNNHLVMTTELNSLINKLFEKPQHIMSKDIAELHSMYANIRQRLERVKTHYQNILITWSEGDKLLTDLMKFEVSGNNSIDGQNQNFEYFGPDSQSERRLEYCNDDDKLDGLERLFNTDTIVDEEEKTIVETPHNSNSLFRLMKWITSIFCLIVMILWSVDFLEPQCSEVCDLQDNNYNWLFELGLRYFNATDSSGTDIC